MKKFALLAGLFVFAPMTWRRTTILRTVCRQKPILLAQKPTKWQKLTAHKLQKLLR